MESLLNSTEHLKGNQHQSFSNSSKKQKRGKHFPTHSMKSGFPSHQCHIKTSQNGKSETNTRYESPCKILNKIPATPIHQPLKRLTRHKVEFTLGTRGRFGVRKSSRVTVLERTKHTVTSADAGKAFPNGNALS